jgi:tetratricopeptide (TPR) repeat protein
MRAYVFTDQSLTSEAGRFVWLEMDNEKAVNTPLRKKLDIRALPSFFILDPKDERIAVRWIGGMSLDQLKKMLADGRAEVDGRNGGTPADTLFARAERLFGASDNPGAAQAYLAALQVAPAGWSHEARATESALFALSEIDSNEAIAKLSERELPRLKGTVSSANVAGYGLGAAVALPKDHPRRTAWLTMFETASNQIVVDPGIPLSGDDRSGLYISLLDARKDANDSLGARRVAEAWSQALDEAAAKAPTPDARTVYDSHRLSAYVELGQPEKAVPMLQQSEKDFPDDYNPPARLAIAYRNMKKWPEAIAASDRALAKVYGPRTLTVLNARTDIYLAMGDTTSARGTLERTMVVAGNVLDKDRADRYIPSVQKRIDGLKH